MFLKHALEKVLDLGDGHHLRYRSEILFPIKVRIERYRSVHLTDVDNVIAWSTRNAVVRADDVGPEVTDIEALAEAIAVWESSSAEDERRPMRRAPRSSKTRKVRT